MKNLTELKIGDIVRFKGEFTADPTGYIVKVDKRALGHYKNGSLEALPYTIRWFDGHDDSVAAERHLEKIV